MSRSVKSTATGSIPAALARAHSPGPQVQPNSPFRRRLLRLHQILLDRMDAGPERIATGLPVSPGDLTTTGDNRTNAWSWLPSPRHVARELLSLIPEPQNRVFFDLGSGRGRIVLEAARLPFQRAVGVESVEELHEDATMNLRHWPRARMACRDVDFIHADAATVPLPKADLAVYMFNPFNERLTTRVAARLAEHARRHRVHVTLLDPSHAMAFRESVAFREVETPKAARRRLAWLSPYEIRIYEAGGTG